MGLVQALRRLFIGEKPPWVGMWGRALALSIGGLTVAVLTAQSVDADTPTPSQLQGYDTQNLRWLEYHYPSLYRQIEKLPWVGDGLSNLEKEIIDEMLYLGGEDISMLESIIPMPFLQSSDATDPLAIYGMWRLVYEGASTSLQEHAAFQDGISEDEAVLVAAAGTVYRDTYEVSRMLNPGYATVESSTRETGVQLSIVRTGNQPQAWTIGSLADAVEFVEQIMLEGLPVGHVVLVLSNKAIRLGAAGSNYDFAISYSPDYEQSQDTFEGQHLQLGLTHEVAHYFWRDNADWIDEGLANTIEYLYGIDTGLNPEPPETDRRDCTIQSLKELSELTVLTEEQFYCNYYLGSGLFQELRRNMTEAEFSQRLGELYSQTLAKQELRQEAGIETVRSVFSDHLGIVDKHWYGERQATTGITVGDQYDTNYSGVIELDEALDAVGAYFAGVLDLEGALDIVGLYFKGLQ